MNLTLSTLLTIAALIVFLVAAIGWAYKKTDLIAAGLALFVLSILVTYLPPSQVSIGLIILFAAFVVLVVAAIGWRFRKFNLLPIGLALWMLSALLPGLQVG